MFTTHTPVPAGNEVFDPELVRRNVGHLVERCGLSWDEFAALGKIEPDGHGLRPDAVRAADVGVRERRLRAPRRGLAGDVARLWPDRPVDQVPITSITNGVHARTWISDELEDLLGHAVPDFDARARAPRRGALVGASRGEGAHARVRRAHARRDSTLDPDALTIGFARRFATYKRASLLFSQPERLLRLLGDADRPVQILLAGKAHPADDGGKDVIQHVVEFARDAEAAGRVVFLPDYEMTLARRLVQGVDVWLNTPRRPMEASGTSGMKAALNGALNCSILDGWWAEGYTPSHAGSRSAPARTSPTDEEQDAADAEALYARARAAGAPRVLRARRATGSRARWIEMMRHSIAELGPQFSTNRMVAEYVERLYLPAHRDRSAGARRRSGPCSAVTGDAELVLRVADPLLELPPVRGRLAGLDPLELRLRLVELPLRARVVDLAGGDGVVDERDRPVLRAPGRSPGRSRTPARRPRSTCTRVEPAFSIATSGA